MFEVECPSCHAGYKVDERRVPATGLKMRCPKCGESFQVTGAGPSEPPVLGAALGLPPPAAGAARNSKRTMLGVAPAQPGAPPSRGGPPAPASSHFELASIDEDDLPALPGSDLEADLPRAASGAAWAPAPQGGRAKPKEIDLFGESSPPGPGDSGGYGGEFDLPSPSAGLPELPRPGARAPVAELPDLVSAGLPSPSAGLPSPSGDLPSPAGAGLPATSAELPSLGGSLPSLGGSLPAPRGKRGHGGLLPSLNPETPGLSEPPEEVEISEADDFLLSQAPRPLSDSPPDPFGDGPMTRPESTPPGQADPATFGDVDLGSEDLEEDAEDSGGEFDAFPTESGAGAARRSNTTGYGDVSLDDGDDDALGLDGAMGLDGDVDRAPAPRGPMPAASAPLDRSSKPVPQVKTPRSNLSAGVKIGAAAAVLFAIAGGALGAVFPDLGPYGAYWVLDKVHAEDYRTSLVADARRAREALARDTAQDARTAFQLIDAGRTQAPRFRSRVALAAYVGFLGEVRFGTGSGAGAAASALLQPLGEADPTEVDYLELARLAAAVASGKADAALNAALIARGPDYAVLVGEAALLAHKPDLAVQAFTILGQTERGARAHFGLARAQAAKGDAKQSEAQAKLVLDANPAHVGAQLLLAERRVRERKLDADLLPVLLPLSQGQGGASVGERTRALILLGELHLARGRLNEAEGAFNGALALQSGNSVAQRGLADALFESGKFSEAQTRYEAALKADPSSLAAGLGLVRSRIRLEELETAVTLLNELKKQHPDSTALQYWSGRVEEQLGHREASQKAYEEAIKKGEPGAELVNSYVALTRLLGQEGKSARADEVIREAEERFPNDPLVYEALAELASSRGSFEAAVEDYDRALALDPENLGLHFAKAVALRKGRRFDVAVQELDLVEKAAKDYPGLALERGNLLEASGQSADALAAYEKALAEAPDSLDMMLRVGCARASAGQGAPAVGLLKAVFDERPNSAEVNFCLGLAHLNISTKLEDARRYLQRAVGFDASRANYHLYVGWVAIELGDFPLAAASLEKAISLDQTLADAYWKRGELRVRQGAVDDAVRDLNRALELSPSRYEAHAQLGLAYLQNGREPLALEELGKATAEAGIEPYFNYRYGELLLNHHRRDEAIEQLKKAIVGVETAESPPPWLWEAHRLLAMAMGRQTAALEHWRAYADHAASNSPYLVDATREMDAILRMAGH